MNAIEITGQVVDIFSRRTYPAKVTVEQGKIRNIEPVQSEVSNHFIVPGFIDAHVHIESSMLIPAEFARLAVVHGTVATVSDPHEIANVCGRQGIDFMVENGKQVPFKFNFGVPSCVPATSFETAGAAITAADVREMIETGDFLYLSEMMNFPGVLSGDEEVVSKINSAKRSGKPVDGHAPGLRGDDARRYIEAGMSTDHECFTKEEALDKLQYGMRILIREGSAARNFEALYSLIDEYPEQVMFCSDDKHPDNLVDGHIDELCRRAVKKGQNVFNVLRAACINPVLHYNLPVGLLRIDDPADFVILDSLETFGVVETYIDGRKVAEQGHTLIDFIPKQKIAVNNFSCTQKNLEDFRFDLSDHPELPIIEALDGQLITNRVKLIDLRDKGADKDILKIVVVNRYFDAPIAKGFIKNFGLQRGAIASSVAHDSHNIVCVGVDDEAIVKAVNLVIAEKGGISCYSLESSLVLPLPVGGLMSDDDGYKVARAYTAIDKMAKEMGSTLSAPFMTLSFMALLVIPHLKLSDKGLFDGDSFKLIGQH